MNEPDTKFYNVKGRDGSVFASDIRKLGLALNWVDKLLECTHHASLMSKLNDIQRDVRTKDGMTVYEYKDQIPLSIVNLVLREYGLEIEEV